MKKTTYILLGTLITILILLFFFPIFLNMMESNDKSYLEELNIDKDKYAVNKYKDVKAIKLINNDNNKRMIEYNTTITPVDSNITTVSLPDSKYFTSSQKGDTLLVEINIDLPKTHIYKYGDNKINIKITTPDNLNYIGSEYSYITEIKGMKGDSISCNINESTIIFNNSTFRAINFKGWSSDFKAKESTIDSLYIDNDGYIRWTIDKCNIDTEFITGSSYVDNKFTKDECKRIVWTPKGDKSKIAIRGNQKFIITPCKK